MFEDKVPLKVTGRRHRGARGHRGAERRRDQQAGRPQGPQDGRDRREHDLPRHADPRAEGARLRPPEGRADRHRDRPARHGQRAQHEGRRRHAQLDADDRAGRVQRSAASTWSSTSTCGGRRRGAPPGTRCTCATLVNPSFIEKNPALPKDLNDAQREAVDIWYKNRPRAHRDRDRDHQAAPGRGGVRLRADGRRCSTGCRTSRSTAWSLQLKLTKESGFLKSDIWDSPDRIKKEFLWRG